MKSSIEKGDVIRATIDGEEQTLTVLKVDNHYAYVDCFVGEHLVHKRDLAILLENCILVKKYKPPFFSNEEVKDMLENHK